ncbi:hypothetical protein NP233_g9261 [Leucocoprinus birnbaumii]|uniref:F-box domain-containing protein n=1 Tax=Leucocoprinus birnbaumii TaxID=56174 RepID=A0AAD5YNC4_9AGAR|nr:hypothetical protein NP233_g9261 [Leucocoprinus birnbaumii]
MISQSGTFADCPSDILLEILQHILPPAHEYRQRHAELTALRVVCQYWDTVIVTTPHLWSSINIHFPITDIPVPLFHQWLLRSSNAALDISIRDRAPINWTDTEIKHRSKLMLILNSHISRCRTLQLEITTGLLPGLCELSIVDASRLESFEVNMRGIIEESVHARLLQQLTSLSSLRSVTITTHYPLFMSQFLRLSTSSWLNQLCCVKLFCLTTTNQMLELMKGCISATEIALNPVRYSIDSPSSTASQNIPLPHLRKLDLTVTSSNPYHSLTQQFSFPSLASLNISGLTISDIYPTVQRFPPSLASLKLRISNTQKLDINEICTFVRDPNVLRLQFLEIESREYEGWTEYDGWDDMNERPIRQAVEDFNKSKDGSRIIKCNTFSERFKRFLISWADVCNINDRF